MFQTVKNFFLSTLWVFLLSGILGALINWWLLFINSHPIALRVGW